jgi:uncharacterized protein
MRKLFKIVARHCECFEEFLALPIAAVRIVDRKKDRVAIRYSMWFYTENRTAFAVDRRAVAGAWAGRHVRNNRWSGRPMRIEDRFVVAAPRERVWLAIKDPSVVAPCIPGCQGVEIVSPTHYKARIRVQVGPIKAEFNVEIVSETAPEEVRSRTRGEEGSRASSLSAENTLRLAALGDNETEVSYASEAAIVGRESSASA